MKKKHFIVFLLCLFLIGFIIIKQDISSEKFENERFSFEYPTRMGKVLTKSIPINELGMSSYDSTYEKNDRLFLFFKGGNSFRSGIINFQDSPQNGWSIFLEKVKFPDDLKIIADTLKFK